MKREMTRGSVALKAWRDSQEPKVTQHQIAVALGAKSVFTISKWERGIQVPTIVEALAIEQFTGGGVAVAWWGESAPSARDTLPLDYVPSLTDAPPPGDEDESELPREVA